MVLNQMNEGASIASGKVVTATLPLEQAMTKNNGNAALDHSAVPTEAVVITNT